MKKLLVLTAAIALFASPALAGISGTAHDMSTDTWNGTGELCIVCHTPHNAGDTPLWNRSTPAGPFTPYDDTNTSTTLDANPGAPGSISQMCLSCHDGVTGLDAFAGSAGPLTPLTGTAALGTDLTDDHPIGFDYTDALATADTELYQPTLTNSGLGGTIADDLLFNNALECASCHDVHDNTNAPFLIMGNSNSALCLTCHNK